jgi:hypothetical protein
MGQFPVGDYVIPGVRESFYGRFAVNLGVLLPAVLRIEHSRDRPEFAREYDCEIRDRLGRLAYEEDTWWDLDHQVAATAQSVAGLMDQHGLPFLDQFEDYRCVLSHLAQTGTLPFHNEGRSALVGALICCHLGEGDRASELFDRAVAYAKSLPNKGFLEHVTDLRARSTSGS